MPDASAPTVACQRSDERFASTHWSVILAAARTESPQAREALEKLCAAYWYPLYAYLRRSGCRPDAAEDLTQEFFATHVINRRVLQGANPAGGRFRSWLLTSLQNLVRNEHAKEMAAKRGGRVPHLPLNWQDAEGRYLAEPGHGLTPERLYERSWALTLLERVVRLLGARYADTGRTQLFDELKQFLPGEHSTRPLAGVAARLNRSEDAVKMAISRLRREYGELLTVELRRTVGDAREVEAERQHLLAVLGDG